MPSPMAHTGEPRNAPCQGDCGRWAAVCDFCNEAWCTDCFDGHKHRPKPVVADKVERGDG